MNHTNFLLLNIIKKILTQGLIIAILTMLITAQAVQARDWSETRQQLIDQSFTSDSWAVVITHRGTPLPDTAVNFLCNEVKLP